MTTRLSVDIGGTFTDVVLDTGAGLCVTKVLTTYADPALGVMAGIDDVLEQAAVAPEDVQLVLHGTTLATNALIERRGAKTALLTTLGHRDILEMAFENRFEQYDINIDRPTPLVSRELRMGVPERIASDGTVLQPLDETALRESLSTLQGAHVESLAIGFLHSYANPVHERRAAELAAEVLPGIPISISASVCPEIREYERLSTTVANAYVKPRMAAYLNSLASRLEALGIVGPLLMMTSGGGLTTLRNAAEFPIRLVESGPAGGAILAESVAQAYDLASVLSFDMGGTTAKICLIDDHQALRSRTFEVDRSYRFKKGSGLPVRIPVIEMVEIGAGGGSIAHVDDLQRVLVGPESAASEPGPACYGRGGNHATVTDADAVLGRLSADHFAGGSLALDLDAARNVVDNSVGQPLSQDPSSAATTVSEIVEENMAAAARAHASEWGLDFSNRSLIAFGGAAPMHAVGVARKLKIRTIIVPPGAGVGSAVGFLLAPIRYEVVRSRYCTLDTLAADDIERLFADMRIEAEAVVAPAAGGQAISEHRQVYMRYAGQGYEVAVDINELSEPALLEGFSEQYRQLYGRIIPGMQVECISWTLALTTPPQPPLFREMSTEEHTLKAYAEQAYVEDSHPAVRPVYLRETCARGIRFAGPALVVDEHTSLHLPSGVELFTLPDGALRIELLEL